MENPLTVKNILNEDIQEKENEFRFLFSYKKQNCKTRIIIFSLVLILFLLIILLIFTSKIFSNSDKNNTNEQNTKNEIEMKYIPEIGKNFPFSLIINDYGKISTDDNCFEDISPDKIKYEKEAFFSYDKKNIEQNSQISNSDNIGISIIGDKIPFLSDFIFKAKIDSVYQKSINNTNIIVKSQISSLSIKRKDIKFDDSFLNKIKKIGLDESYNDEEKASLLNNIFKSYGYFIPLKIYFGGYFYQEVDKIEYQENRKFLMSLKSNVNINFDNKSLNGTFNNSISYKSFFNNLFSHERINIIGGDITKNTLDEWKNSLNDKNSKIVGYENLIPITDLLNDVLGYDTFFLLSKPFNLTYVLSAFAF